VANFLFYVMAAIAVAGAALVVLCRNPVNSVLALLASFFALAIIYLLAGFQFIAAAQVLVYAGAVLVLFLFVIMLLNLGNLRGLEKIDALLLRRRKSAWTLGIATSLFVLALAAIVESPPALAAAEPPANGYDGMSALAPALFGRYILPFEAVSMLLLATAVAVVVLAKRQRRTPQPPSPSGSSAERAS
jgi:NADH-quinone oxidoreductase subunit J